MDGNTLERQGVALKAGVRSPGMVYAETLKRHFPDIDVDRVNAAEPGEVLPPGASLEDYDGLVIGGSGLHAYHQVPEVTRQIDMVRAYSQTGGPILGSCWGLQIAVIAAGGAVDRSPNGREIVFARKLTLTDTGRQHPFFAGKPVSFDAPCIHVDEISSLPSEATLLCTNRHSEVQGVTMPLGKSEFWGIQYHPEFDMEHLYGMVRLFSELMIDEQFFADAEECEAYASALERLARDPASSTMQWQLGVNDEIVDDALRSAEIINWVRYCVLGQR